MSTLPDHSNLGKAKLIFGSQFEGTVHHGEKAWRQYPEAIVHFVSAVRKQREEMSILSFLSPLYWVQVPNPWKGSSWFSQPFLEMSSRTHLVIPGFHGNYRKSRLITTGHVVSVTWKLMWLRLHLSYVSWQSPSVLPLLCCLDSCWGQFANPGAILVTSGSL